MIRQRPVKGGRRQLPSCVLEKIRLAVEREARRYNCSMSLVVAFAICEGMGLNFKEMESPEEAVTRARRQNPRKQHRRAA